MTAFNYVVDRTENHQFKVGDKVIYTNDFGVCWGVKIIIHCAIFPTTRHEDGPQEPRYHYEGTDTPWFPVAERNLTQATAEDLAHHDKGDDDYFQRKHGFQPTLEQLGGCA